VSKANFVTWFRNTGIGQYQQGYVTVCVPNTFTKSWLEKKYHADIIRALERITGHPVKKVEYVVENIKNLEEQEMAVSAQPNSNPISPLPSYLPPSPPFLEKRTFVTEFGLNPKYT